MTTRHALLPLLLLAGTLGAAPASPREGPGDIRLPVVVDPAPAPKPPPAPDQPVALSPDRLYVIDSDRDIVVIASPKGVVTLTEDAGPLRIRGKFVGGPDKTETRTFAGKRVVVVEAARGGVCELLVVPVGAATAADVIRQTLVVGGQQPVPPPPKPVDPVNPPKPVDPPAPKPVDPPVPPPIPGAGLRVLVVYESADLARLPAAQQAILFGKETRDYLNAACAVGPDGRTREWRLFDKDVPLTPDTKVWQDAKLRPRAGLPAVVIANGVTGYEGPLPATPAEFVALVKKYEGGK